MITGWARYSRSLPLASPRTAWNSARTSPMRAITPGAIVAALPLGRGRRGDGRQHDPRRQARETPPQVEGAHRSHRVAGEPGSRAQQDVAGAHGRDLEGGLHGSDRKTGPPDRASAHGRHLASDRGLTSRRARLDQPLIEGEHDGGRPVTQLQLREDVPDVGLHGSFADEERRSDLRVAGSATDQQQDVSLAVGELGEPGGGLRTRASTSCGRRRAPDPPPPDRARRPRRQRCAWRG